MLDEFVAFFNGHKLAKGTAVVVKSNGSGTLEVVIKPAMVKDYSQVCYFTCNVYVYNVVF